MAENYFSVFPSRRPSYLSRTIPLDTAGFLNLYFLRQNAPADDLDPAFIEELGIADLAFHGSRSQSILVATIKVLDSGGDDTLKAGYLVSALLA
ncbi:hypothetical protein [Anaeroselena agilis]|uniref:Uncharacterized protein n=1 Tax=Anaeroselena agilis TaxID=3063788 RepID=A0ABU3NVS3_9FIRM|nr:hypothetical protein [Selenomonadales bacterium 4137-cl]